MRQRLDSSPVAVLHSVVLDNDTRSLDVRRFEVSEQTVLVTGGGGDAVVANQRLCEDKNLSTVGRVGHGLGVSNERGGENGFTGDVGFGAEGLAGEDGAILEAVSGSGEVCIESQTLMVNVARSFEIGVDLRPGEGISRAVFVCTVARPRARMRFFVTCPRTPADRAAGLRSCENMLSRVLTGVVGGITVVCVGFQFTEAFHRWSGEESVGRSVRRSSGGSIPEM